MFDSSMMVHFRKRFPVEFVAQVNEYVCTEKWPEKHRNVDRNVVESRNGILKRRFDLGLIMSKLDETAKTEAAMDILAMNARRRVRDIFLHVLTCRICYGRFEAGFA